MATSDELRSTQGLNPPDIFQAQGPSPQTVGTRYSTIEYIEVHPGLPVGPQGPTGPEEPPGEDGAEWHFGNGDPNDNGTDHSGPNDMYIDQTTGEVWYWNSVAQKWLPAGYNFIGPTGPQGLRGFTGPTGATGPQGIQGGGIKVEGILPGAGPPAHNGVPGEGWIDNNGDLWGWIEGQGWYNYGQIMGPTGPAGPAIQTLAVDFQFEVNGMWATQTINHSLANPTPTVRTLIDFDNNGTFTAAQTVQVDYPSTTAVLITADVSIINYNPPGIPPAGVGKVILQ